MNKIQKTQENENAKAGKFVASVPDLTDWIQDYYFTVSLCEAVESMKHTLTKENSPTSSDLETTADGRLVLSHQAKNVLKAHCEEDHWQYFEDYLLA